VSTPRPRGSCSLAIALIATTLILPLAPALGLTDCACDATMCVHRHGVAGAHQPEQATDSGAAAGGHCARASNAPPRSSVRGCAGADDHALPSLSLGTLTPATGIATPQGAGAVPAAATTPRLDHTSSIETPPPDASVN
jgi:hypothetical protein